MKKLIALACMGVVYAVSTPVYAGPQQDKMKACNAEAKDMKGDDRKAFMKKCLSGGEGKEMKAAATAQQDKMKTCNADAKTKGLAGPDRKKFMSECLKK